MAIKIDWTRIRIYPTSEISSICCSDDGQVIAINTPDGVHLSTNGGTSWSLKSLSSWGIVKDVECNKDGSVLIANNYDYFYTSTNSGANWTLRSPTLVDGADIARDTNTIWVFCRNNYIKKSTDNGANWTNIVSTSGMMGFLNVSKDGQCIAYVFWGTDKIYYSTNGGSSFSTLTPASPYDISRVAVSNNGVILAELHSYPTFKYLLSTNGGSSFSDISLESPFYSSISHSRMFWVSGNGEKIIMESRGKLYMSVDSGSSFEVIKDLYADYEIRFGGINSNSDGSIILLTEEPIDNGMEWTYHIQIGEIKGWGNILKVNGVGQDQIAKLYGVPKDKIAKINGIPV